MATTTMMTTRGVAGTMPQTTSPSEHAAVQEQEEDVLITHTAQIAVQAKPSTTMAEAMPPIAPGVPEEMLAEAMMVDEEEPEDEKTEAQAEAAWFVANLLQRQQGNRIQILMSTSTTTRTCSMPLRRLGSDTLFRWLSSMLKTK
jgi:hypothetical protein